MGKLASLGLAGEKPKSPVSASIKGDTSKTSSTSLTDQNGISSDTSTSDTNGNNITSDRNASARLTDSDSRSYNKNYSDLGLSNQNAQNIASYAKSFAELDSESMAISNTAQSSLQVQNQSSTNTATLASRFGALSQEDFVNGLGEETKAKMMKEGIIDSTGSFVGEYAKMWQEKRELNEHNPGWNNTQRNNDATIETMVAAANKIAEKGGSENYAAAADIYGTLNNGAHDGSFEGAYDKTLQLIQNDFQNLSGMVGKEALDQQVTDAGGTPFNAQENNNNIDKIKGDCCCWTAKNRRRCEQSKKYRVIS